MLTLTFELSWGARMTHRFSALTLILFVFGLISFQEIIASEQKTPEIIGNADAPKGGTFLLNFGGGEPSTLNPLSSTDYNATLVQEYIAETLLRRNLETYEWEASLATEWSISDNGLVYEFTLREGVQWHDGKPVTVEDIKFSFDAIMDPENRYRTAHMKAYYENIEKVEIVGRNRVRFTANQVYFRNFDSVAGLTVLPRHVYENPSKEQGRILNRTIIGSGPYTIEVFNRGRNIVLMANKKWWGHQVPKYKGVYNFDRIVIRFVSDGTVALQRLMRGDLDFNALSPEEYEQKAVGPRWGKDVYKVKTKNIQPKGYGFIAWNLENDLFKSRNVRTALYHLVNRREMIDKFLFGHSAPATGPLYAQSVYADPEVKPIEYDPARAGVLFKQEGWLPGSDGVLRKEINGQMKRMSFTILVPNEAMVKYLTLFKENAIQQGVDINIRLLEWNSFINMLNERNFEAVTLAWSGGAVDWDPKQIWHSDSASNQGSNFTNYKNPEVDRLIDEARLIMDREERIKRLRKVYRLIAEDAPYVFLFNAEYTFYSHTKRMSRVKDSLQYSVGTNYWWITPSN
jgi:ABC-type transport system substrate-binding protein